MPKEYIEREVALNKIKKLQKTDPATVGKKQFSEGYFCGLYEAEIVLLQTPTADVEEVVRCRECINLICVEVKDGCIYKCRRNELTEVDMHLNGYCCHGKKRIRSE